MQNSIPLKMMQSYAQAMMTTVLKATPIMGTTRFLALNWKPRGTEV